MLGFLSRRRRHHHRPEDAPDTWTEDRTARLVEIDRADGDVALARERWAGKTHLSFVTWLYDHGRIGEGVDRER